MGHRLRQGGPRRPDYTVKRDRGSRKTEWNISPHAIPWPVLDDGTPWTPGLGKVSHVQVPESVGAVEEPVVWEGGAWWATVAWEDDTVAKIPLVNLMLSTDA